MTAAAMRLHRHSCNRGPIANSVEGLVPIAGGGARRGGKALGSMEAGHRSGDAALCTCSRLNAGFCGVPGMHRLCHALIEQVLLVAASEAARERYGVAVPSVSHPSKTAAATAEPMVPTVDVVCQNA